MFGIHTFFYLFQGMPIQFLQDIGVMIDIPLCKALFKDEWDDRKKRDFIPVLTLKLCDYCDFRASSRKLLKLHKKSCDNNPKRESNRTGYNFNYTQKSKYVPTTIAGFP